MAVISADPYKEDLNDFDRAPQQLAGFEETPVHASDTMYSRLLHLCMLRLLLTDQQATFDISIF